MGNSNLDRKGSRDPGGGQQGRTYKASKHGVVVCDPSLCRGCMVCTLVCSLSHRGACGRALSAIYISANYMIMDFSADICQQCGAASCMAACRVEGAMYVDSNSGAKCIDQDKCVGCGLCAEACPLNGEGNIIKYNPETNTYFKCDLCGGNPLCVKYCPRGALSYVASEGR